MSLIALHPSTHLHAQSSDLWSSSVNHQHNGGVWTQSWLLLSQARIGSFSTEKERHNKWASNNCHVKDWCLSFKNIQDHSQVTTSWTLLFVFGSCFGEAPNNTASYEEKTKLQHDFTNKKNLRSRKFSFGNIVQLWHIKRNVELRHSAFASNILL